MNFKVVSRNIGKALLVNAFFMLLSVAISVANGYDSGFSPLLISALITLVVGFFPFIFGHEVPDVKMKEGYVIIVSAWLLSFLAGALPYIMYGGEFTVINAWYESVSGYTTTGSTVLTDIEALPESLLFWRSSTQFIGGLGVIVFLLLIFPESSPFKLRVSNLEISSMARTGYQFRADTTIRIMLGVYIVMTIAETILLKLAGMSFFDAVNHSFCTVSTGGFSTKNASIMHYDSVWIDMVITLFMIMSSLHFGIIYAVCAKRSLKPLASSISRYYLTVILLLSISVMLLLKIQGGYHTWGKAMLDAVFQVSSFISTTGFGQADNSSWPFLANLLLIFSAIHCGCSGSTTGGLKADRFMIAVRELRNEFLRRMHPASVFRTRIDGHVLKNDIMSSVFTYIVTYMVFILIFFLVILFYGVDVDVAFSGTVASLGNVGPGIGAIGTMGNSADLPSAVKFIFTLEMFVGRLEIFPVLIVISMIAGKSRL
jgi:trk system potassium uptake protein TrkH